MLGAIQAAVVGTLGWRLKSMQLDRADEFRLLSDGNSIKLRLLPPARGLIHDRNGIVIAGNEQNYRVTLTREEAGGEVEPVLHRLARLIPISDARMAELLEPYAGQRYRAQVVITATAGHRPRRGPRRSLPTHLPTRF